MVNWAISQQPNAFETAFDRGFQLAEYGRQRRQQEERQNALAAYATDPNDQNFNVLAQAVPEYAIQERQRRDAARQQQQVGQLVTQGAQGNTDAILQLWGVDPAMAARLDTREREHAAQGLSYLSQAALAIDGMPEQSRAAAWDDAIQRGVQMGFNDLGEYQGQYSPQALQAVVARAGQMGDLMGNRQPRYMAIPEGGTLVNTRSPQAVQSYTQGQFPNAPQVGAVEEGYRYRGGDPANPQSWEQVGQQMSATSGPPTPTTTPEGLGAMISVHGADQVQQWMQSGQLTVRSN